MFQNVNLFGIEYENNEEKILKKISSPKSPSKTISKKFTFEEKMIFIENEVNRILGSYKNDTEVIYDKNRLQEYTSDCVKNGIVAIDTETNNSLTPTECKLMGLCLYTPNNKHVYVPINHIDRVSGKRLSNQLTESDIKEELIKLSNIKTIWHNAKFDYSVLKCTCGVQMPVFWDTIIGARVLNENEKYNLKLQYKLKVDSSMEKYDINHLFEGELYEIFPPELFALYAATDAYMTYKLYEYQLGEFTKPENDRLFSLFKNIEIPVIIPTAEMELNGISIDYDYAKRLSKKFHGLYEETEKLLSEEWKKLKPTVDKWKETPEAQKNSITYDSNGKQKIQKSLAEKLDDPINFDSPTQMAILIYDILKVPAVNKTSPRSTSKEDIDTIVSKYPELTILRLVSEKKHILKQLNTYIDKIPECVLSDGKVHASFNQYGADTGRYSSENPNLQNIPSRGDEKSIRVMFKASPGCVMLGSDFSSQEPRLLATYAQDPGMIEAYTTNKDLYAVIGSKVYKNNYEDNLEKFADGTPNKAGKARRSACKNILLGIMYGRGAASIAEKLKCTKEEAQNIIDGFYREFPNVKSWITTTETTCADVGYVEDLWGRRRRLPDLQLPQYDISAKSSTTEFNPILFTSGINANLSKPLIDKYLKKLNGAKYYKDVEKIQKEAKLEGITIKNNGALISKAKRQCVNARVQGGAASMSKRAMISIYNDEEMKKLGFKLLIMVHDELIGECPIENVEAVKQRLSKCMEDAGKPEVTLPMKCDVVTFPNWYIDECADSIHEKYVGMIESGETADKALNELVKKYCEFTEEQIKSFCLESSN